MEATSIVHLFIYEKIHQNELTQNCVLCGVCTLNTITYEVSEVLIQDISMVCLSKAARIHWNEDINYIYYLLSKGIQSDNFIDPGHLTFHFTNKRKQNKIFGFIRIVSAYEKEIKGFSNIPFGTYINTNAHKTDVGGNSKLIFLKSSIFGLDFIFLFFLFFSSSSSSEQLDSKSFFFLFQIF